jgi:hypothetical protein
MIKSKIAFAVIVLIPANASAVTPLTTTVSVAGSATEVQTSSLTANASGASATNINTGSASATGVSLGQFNTANGILVAARVRVAGVSTSVTSQVTGTVNANGNGRTVTTNTSLAGAVSAAGITSITNAASAANRSCSGGNCANSPGNSSTSNPGPTLAGTATVAAASLSAYAGTGTVTLGRAGVGSTTVTNGSGAQSGSGIGLYGFTGGTYSIDYDSLKFASPSFSGTTLVTSISIDFGTVNLGTGPVTLNFNLFNTGDINTAGLSLTGIARDNNQSAFTSTLGTFTNNLDAGTNRRYSVTLDPATTGNKIDRFRLALRDFAPGGSVGQREYFLDVAVSGFVHDAAVVPEPATWAMLIAGYGIVGGAVRRRRRLVAV